MKTISRAMSFFVIFAVYAIATALGVLAYILASNVLDVLFSMLVADVVATLFVFAVGLIFKNSSVYDPYWSVAPPLMYAGYLVIRNTALHASDVLLMVATLVWAVRLTRNWAINWKGLKHVDWRYIQIKQKNPKIWLLSNLFGINMMPTLIVFASSYPAYLLIFEGANELFFPILGCIICVVAALIQLVSDRQMRVFRQTKQAGQHIDSGLWRYSRHPNYFGEVLFWWGIFVMQISTLASLLHIWSPIVMTALFLFVSIPLMEKHILEKSPNYSQYQKTVSALVPFFRRENDCELATENE